MARITLTATSLGYVALRCQQTQIAVRVPHAFQIDGLLLSLAEAAEAGQEARFDLGGLVLLAQDGRVTVADGRSRRGIRFSAPSARLLARRFADQAVATTIYSAAALSLAQKQLGAALAGRPGRLH